MNKYKGNKDKCPECKGRKYITKHDELFGRHYRLVCPTCKGKGVVK